MRRLRKPTFVVAALILVSGALASLMFGFPRSSPGKYPRDFEYMRGVNVNSLEIAPKSGPERFVGEPSSFYAYLRKNGVRLVRLDIPWASLQPVLPGVSLRESLDRPVDPAYLAFLKREVVKMETHGLFPVIDLHNGCAYPVGPSLDKAKQELYCGDGMTTRDAIKIWLALSSAFRDDPLIAAYDLFNEPRADHISFAVYKRYTQSVVDALRARKDQHVIWVEAMTHESFTFAHSVPTGPWLHDPLRKIEYSQHFYPDSTASKNQPYPASPPRRFVQSLTAFGEWCSRFAVRCSIGEVGWPRGQPGDTPFSGLQWNELGEQLYDIADQYKMDVTYFAASATSSNWLSVFGPTPGRAHRKPFASYSQLAVLRAHESKLRL